MKHSAWSMALAGLAASGVALAAIARIEAEQVNVDPGNETMLGGSPSTRLAQSFRVGTRGKLSHLMVALNCQPLANVQVNIERTDAAGVPTGVVLASESYAGGTFNSIRTPAVGLRMVEFKPAPMLSAGTYAFTLASTGGDCGAYVGPEGDFYPDGKGYFISAANGPNWLEFFFGAGDTRDLPFQVFMTR